MSVSAPDSLQSVRDVLGLYLLPPLADMVVDYASPYSVSISQKGDKTFGNFSSGRGWKLKIARPVLDSDGEWSEHTVLSLSIEGEKKYDLSLLETAINSAEHRKNTLGYFREYEKNKQHVNLDCVFATLAANQELSAALAMKEVRSEQIKSQVEALPQDLASKLRLEEKNPYYPQVKQVAINLAQNESPRVRTTLMAILNGEAYDLHDASKVEGIFEQAQRIVLEKALEGIDN